MIVQRDRSEGVCAQWPRIFWPAMVRLGSVRSAGIASPSGLVGHGLAGCETSITMIDIFSFSRAVRLSCSLC